jgi:hypothetical protein
MAKLENNGTGLNKKVRLTGLTFLFVSDTVLILLEVPWREPINRPEYQY